jgi:CubicO group peptidase (beta-lactamase class C family)
LGGEIDSALTIEQWLDGLASLPLVSQPGELFSYGRSTDLLGILISKIEGKFLGKVMEEKIFRPLNMADTFFYVPDEKKSKRAENIGYDESGKLVNLETVPAKMSFKERPEGLEFEAGSGGLWSTIGDYLKFAKVFVEVGCSDNVRILKKDTLELMCTNHLSDYQREHSKLLGSAMFREYYGFGLGLAVVMKENKYSSMPCAGLVGSVGWPGAFGGWWSADPVKKSIAIFLTHSMTELHQLAKGIGFEMYEAIDLFAGYCREKTESRS